MSKRALDVSVSQSNTRHKGDAGPSSGEDAAAKEAQTVARMHDALRQKFGYAAFRGQQEEAIKAAMAGRDVFVLMPTGGGKSLCYTIPALIQPGVVVVVSPLIALMQDQVAGLLARGVCAAQLSSALPERVRKDVLCDLRQRRPETRVLFVTPELLATSHFQGVLESMSDRRSLALFAVDEAHCISSWGHDFRPQYRALGSTLRGKLPRVPIMALTATAAVQVQNDIIHQLSLRDPLRLLSSFNRPNIDYSVLYVDGGASAKVAAATSGGTGAAAVSVATAPVTAAAGAAAAAGGVVDKDEASDAGEKCKLMHLRALVKQACPPTSDSAQQQSAIVYCHKRETVETVARALQAAGVGCRPYHGALGDAERARTLSDWQAGHLPVVAATIAFGMGIDRAAVRLVVHYDMPKCVEGFYQESGRAGRDGLPASSVLLYSERDRSMMAFIAGLGDKRADKCSKKGKGRGGVDPSEERAKRAVGLVAEYCTRAGCRRAYLLAHFGEATTASNACRGGCDYCRDPQGVEAAQAVAASHAASRQYRRGGTAGTPMADWESYGGARGGGHASDSDEICSGSDDDGDAYDDGAAELEGAGIQEDEVAEARQTFGTAAKRAGGGSAGAAAIAAVAAAARAARAAPSSGWGGYFAEMERRERQSENDTARAGGALAGLLGAPAAAARAKAPDDQAHLQEQFRAKLTSVLVDNTDATSGLSRALLEKLSSILERSAQAPGQSHHVYRNKVGQAVQRCKAAKSVFSLLSAQTAGSSGSSSSGDDGGTYLVELLHGELQAVRHVADRLPLLPPPPSAPPLQQQQQSSGVGIAHSVLAGAGVVNTVGRAAGAGGGAVDGGAATAAAAARPATAGCPPSHTSRAVSAVVERLQGLGATPAVTAEILMSNSTLGKQAVALRKHGQSAVAAAAAAVVVSWRDRCTPKG